LPADWLAPWIAGLAGLAGFGPAGLLAGWLGGWLALLVVLVVC